MLASFAKASHVEDKQAWSVLTFSAWMWCHSNSQALVHHHNLLIHHEFYKKRKTDIESKIFRNLQPSRKTRKKR